MNGALVGVLLAWASAVTQIPIPAGEQPVIVEMTREDIAMVAYNGSPPEGNAIKIEALYDHFADEILIPEGTTFSTRYEIAMLGHELVHWLQFHNGDYDLVKCRNELEGEAYEAHFELMVALGSEDRSAAIKESNLNGLSLLFLTQCMDEY